MKKDSRQSVWAQSMVPCWKHRGNSAGSQGKAQRNTASVQREEEDVTSLRVQHSQTGKRGVSHAVTRI